MLLTSTEMLEQWRLRHCLDASTMTGEADEGFDSTDNDLIETARMRDWYADLLARGDPSLTPPTDIAADLPVTAGPGRGEWLIRLIDGVIAVISIETDAGVQADIVNADSPRARLMRGPFGPVPTGRPVAVTDGGNVVRMFTDTGGETPKLRRVMAVTEPPEGFYSLTDKGLAMIPGPELYV